MSNNILKSFWVSPESIKILKTASEQRNISMTKLLEEIIKNLEK